VIPFLGIGHPHDPAMPLKLPAQAVNTKARGARVADSPCCGHAASSAHQITASAIVQSPVR